MKIFTMLCRPWAFLVLVVTSCWGPAADAKSSGDFYEEVSRLNKVLSEINRKYVEDVNPTELSDAAMQGIRGILDPHTTVFSPKDYDDLKIATDGEFGGVGITISIRDNVLTVVSPLAGTPAYNLGIQAGDRIVKIESKSTQNLTLDEAVNKLRGKVGTDVTITIVREGITAPLDFKITRAKIIIHAVPYAGMLDSETGYIKLAQFSQKTASDVEEAIRKLKTQGMKKLVLDLRYNPGGLLNQAIEVGELFLKKGNNIVSTRGRTQETESAATRDGILGSDVPMVVLVNQGSASASEIVAGALQDWDRALIVGKTSFGKGSVQTIFPLDNQGHALKLTTAFYYLPFGRCINKPENGIKGLSLRNGENVDPETGEPLNADSAAVDSAAKDTQVYYTAAGRKMYGGGGITPDVDIEIKPLPWIVQVQERMALYFRFAVKYRAQLEKSKTKVDANWQVPDTVFMAFKEFCLKDTAFTKAKTNAQSTADLLEEILLKEQKYLGDSSKTVTDPELATRIDELRKTLRRQSDAQFASNKEYIMAAIKRELLSSYQGEEARIAFQLKSDNQVSEALRYLKDMNLYKKVMAADPKNKPTSASKKAEAVSKDSKDLKKGKK